MKKMKFSALVLAGAGFMFTSCDDMDNNVNPATSVRLFASNNSNGDVTIYDFKDSGNSMATTTTLSTPSSAADGVFYDADAKTIVQVSRTDKGIEGFMEDASVSLGGIINVSVDLDGSNDMESPRELAVNGNFYVVADNADVDGNASTPDGRLFVYQKTSGGFSLRNVITTDFKLWGITFIGNDLYAVVDADNELAKFENFLSNSSDMTLSATKRVEIEGMTRTHGLTYDVATDIMVMTDIGDAGNTQDDGGFHVINNFISTFNGTAAGGTIGSAAQIIVEGSRTKMGNPVDVAYDGATKSVYIAEAGNGGGRILGFTNVTSGGNITPSMNYDLAAASSVFLHKE